MLQVDYRIGGKPKYIFSMEGLPLMRVPDEVRKCVVFLGYESAMGQYLGGTAFFVSMPLEGVEGRVHVYLVTAKHVIDRVRTRSLNGRVHVRINTRDGGALLVETGVDDWMFHPNESSFVDVAVFPFAPPEEAFDCLYFPSHAFITNKRIADAGIGVGDEVFLTGLFTEHYGKQRNIPIVRMGSIAAMPEEPVDTEMGPMNAYLIEARSIGGLSGSPVFVHMGGIREDPATGQYRQLARSQFYLLGLMHGHWDAKSRRSMVEEEMVNMGISIVVPLYEILEVIDQPKEIERRREVEEEAKRRRLPTPDVSDAAKDDAGEGLTREGFEEVLRRVSRPEEDQSDEASSET